MTEKIKLVKKLNAGEGINVDNASWIFGENTPKKFSEHVKRSVPFYDDGHELVLQISDFFVKETSVCYELGVSTGKLINKLAKRHKKAKKWIGIDKEAGMIEQAKKEIDSELLKNKSVTLIEDDLVCFPYEKSDLMISYYTVQFIQPKYRQEMLNKIFENLNWGGAFLLFEKVRAPDARFQDITTSLYNEYKLSQGYKPDKIIAKSRSLKGILEPFSSSANKDLLKRAGFKDIITVFKWICFEGYLCIK